MLKATKTDTIGDPSSGLGAKANGVFSIVTLRVTNGKNESVTLAGNVVKLESEGKTYDPDISGTTAAIGTGQKPLTLETVGPGVSLTSKVVFDVPPNVLNASPEVRFGELGLGDTKAYIALPATSSTPLTEFCRGRLATGGLKVEVIDRLCGTQIDLQVVGGAVTLGVSTARSLKRPTGHEETTLGALRAPLRRRETSAPRLGSGRWSAQEAVCHAGNGARFGARTCPKPAVPQRT